MDVTADEVSGIDTGSAVVTVERGCVSVVVGIDSVVELIVSVFCDVCGLAVGLSEVGEEGVAAMDTVMSTVEPLVNPAVTAVGSVVGSEVGPVAGSAVGPNVKVVEGTEVGVSTPEVVDPGTSLDIFPLSVLLVTDGLVVKTDPSDVVICGLAVCLVETLFDVT